MIMAALLWDNDTQSMTVQYAGAVLGDYEDNGYHDSYWYAILWDAAQGKVITKEYAATAHAGGGWSQVDATPDVIAKARAYAAEILTENAIRDHAIVGKGKNVKSLTTKGKAKGAIGIVVRFEDAKYQSAWSAKYSPKKVAVIRVTDESNPHCGRELYVDPERLEVTDELTDAIRREYAYAARREAFTSTVTSLFHPKWGALYRVAELYRNGRY
jgi:hypothetical protein